MIKLCTVAAIALFLVGPARADVVSAGQTGFKVHHEIVVAAAPKAAWDTLVQPAKWWNSDHSWSGDAANMSIDPVLGGCFCERWTAGAGPAGATHLTISYINPGQAIRFVGGLGPLMEMGVLGAMVWTVSPEGTGSKIAFTYAVGGYLETEATETKPAGEVWGPIVDFVIGEQIGRLDAVLSSAP